MGGRATGKELQTLRRLALEKSSLSRFLGLADTTRTDGIAPDQKRSTAPVKSVDADQQGLSQQKD